MKTTLDLPDALVKQVKLRAVREGRKLKDAVADLLRKGLAAAADTERNSEAPLITRDKKTGLPLIQCKQAAAPDKEMTPERVADILLAQEVEWHPSQRGSHDLRNIDIKLGNQQNGFMKTTLDLPDDLVRAVKLRALQDGRKLKEAVADLLRKGLAASSAPGPQLATKASARITTDQTTGLPLIICAPNAPASKMTISELLALEQETQTQDDLERLGVST